MTNARECDSAQGYEGMQNSVKERFEQLVIQHQREIYVYISRLTRGASETDDLFQETFLRAYKAYARLPGAANARAWLFTIATNLCRNYFRRLQRHPDVALHEVLSTVERVTSHGNGAAPDDPEQRLLSYDLERHVCSIIDRLPLKQKAALIQRKLHELPYDSIAASLQCSQDAARAHVFQALKKLRTQLEIAPTRRRNPQHTDHDGPARDTL